MIPTNYKYIKSPVSYICIRCGGGGTNANFGDKFMVCGVCGSPRIERLSQPNVTIGRAEYDAIKKAQK